MRHECAPCEDSGWVCESIPIDHGKANMPAPAALPARLARSVTRPQEAKRRDCRMAIEPKFDKKGWRLFHFQVNCCEGFQMTADREMRLAPGPSSESLQ